MVAPRLVATSARIIRTNWNNENILYKLVCPDGKFEVRLMQNSKIESWKNFFEPNRVFDFYTISLLTLHVKSTTWLFFPVSLTFMLTNRTRRNKMRCCVFYSRKDKMIIVETNTETDIDVYI